MHIQNEFHYFEKKMVFYRGAFYGLPAAYTAKSIVKKKILKSGVEKNSSHTESYSVALDFPLEMISERLSSSLNDKRSFE